jgi:hypothetical protein
MSKTNSKTTSARAAGTPIIKSIPRSLAIDQRGVRTSKDFAQLMSAIMSDVLEGSISTEQARRLNSKYNKVLVETERQYRAMKKAGLPFQDRMYQ